MSHKKIYDKQSINDKLVTTLGSTILTVSIDNETEFQVVDSTFPIIGDGILENPFLKANNFIIDVGKEELSTRNENSNIIPARNEFIISVHVNTNEPLGQNVLIQHAHELKKKYIMWKYTQYYKKSTRSNKCNEPHRKTTRNINTKTNRFISRYTRYSLNEQIRTIEKYTNTENRIQILKDSLSCDHMKRQQFKSYVANMQTYFF